MARSGEKTRGAWDLAQPTRESVPPNSRLNRKHHNSSSSFPGPNEPNRIPAGTQLRVRKENKVWPGCLWLHFSNRNVCFCISLSSLESRRQRSLGTPQPSSVQHWMDIRCILWFERKQARHLNGSNFPQTLDVEGATGGSQGAMCGCPVQSLAWEELSGECATYNIWFAFLVTRKWRGQVAS